MKKGRVNMDNNFGEMLTDKGRILQYMSIQKVTIELLSKTSSYDRNHFIERNDSIFSFSLEIIIQFTRVIATISNRLFFSYHTNE